MITTIVLVKAEPRLIPQCAKHLAAIDGVTDVYSVSGEWDLVVLVKVPKYEDIAKIVTEQFPGRARVGADYYAHGVQGVFEGRPRAGMGCWLWVKGKFQGASLRGEFEGRVFRPDAHTEEDSGSGVEWEMRA